MKKWSEKFLSEPNLIANHWSFVLFQNTLKGIGQIMLQDNAITGFIFLIGIFYGSVWMGFSVMLASLVGTIAATLLKYDKANIDKGIYGFSAALVGAAVILFLKPMVISCLLIVAGAVIATWLQQFFFLQKIPVFTLPFVVVTWAILFISHYFFPSLLSSSTSHTIATNNYFIVAFKGFAQVIFQDSFFSGILFFIAVFISSPTSTLYGLAGSLVSTILALYFHTPVEHVAIGIFGYNAVLSAIVFAGNKFSDCIWATISVLFSLLISMIMFHYEVIQLTFPFVVAAGITLMIKNKWISLNKK